MSDFIQRSDRLFLQEPSTVTQIPRPAQQSRELSSKSIVAISESLFLLDQQLEQKKKEIFDRLQCKEVKQHLDCWQQQLDWNQTQQRYPAQCIHQLFEQQVKRCPQAIAVRYVDAHRNESLTYQQLNDRANQLACYLRELGVKPGVKVAVALARSLSMLVTYLSVLKAGGAYVPIDPSYPPERIDYMLQDAQPLLVLAEESTAQTLRNGPVESSQNIRQIINLDCHRDEIAQRPTDAVESGASLEDLAYVIYTSGSTGKPKGVANKHRGVTNLLHSLAKEPGLSENDRLLAITTICFDIAVLELYLPLTVGAQVVITSREIATDGTQLRQQIESQGITVMQGTPATWQLLLAAQWQPSGMKILCGGEAMPPAMAEAIVSGGGQLWNMYGPTETTVWSSIWPIAHSSEATCIGKPIANTQFYILNEALQAVPVGVAGELYIGGDGLAEGYLRRPELTAERFIAWPLADMSSTALDARLYRTGDLARYRPDGTVECLGRLDRQVKIRGFRIELGEIEALLRQHPAIEQAVVVAQTDPAGHPQLVGYVVLAKTISESDLAEVSERSLKQSLKQQIPTYMVPAAIVTLDALPLTLNGKIDVRSLPSPQQIAATTAFSAPRDTLETELQTIWQDTLARAPIGVQDDFFEVGGHSLMVIQLLTTIEKRYGRSLPLSSFLRSPTIAAQANLLRSPHADLQQPHFTSLVPISASNLGQPNSSAHGAQPLFAVHGAGGSVLMYRDLANHLNAQLYGLQSSYINDPARLLTTIEAMADFYLQELRIVQPQGPYVIAGYCGGCPVALEMAQRLRADNQTVSLLVLFDPPPIKTYKTPNLKQYSHALTTKLQDLYSRIQQEGFQQIVSNYWLKALARCCEQLKVPLPLKLRIVKLQAVNMRSLRAYVAQAPYSAPIVMYLPEQGITPQGEIPEGWQTVATGQLTIQSVPGRHHLDGDSAGSFFSEPAVATLASLLNEQLALTA